MRADELQAIPLHIAPNELQAIRQLVAMCEGTAHELDEAAARELLRASNWDMMRALQLASDRAANHVQDDDDMVEVVAVVPAPPVPAPPVPAEGR